MPPVEFLTVWILSNATLWCLLTCFSIPCSFWKVLAGFRFLIKLQGSPFLSPFKFIFARLFHRCCSYIGRHLMTGCLCDISSHGSSSPTSITSLSISKMVKVCFYHSFFIYRLQYFLKEKLLLVAFNQVSKLRSIGEIHLTTYFCK